jgi:hypothetical protein
LLTDAARPDTTPRKTIAPRPADTVAERPVSAPRVEILPCAIEAVEALPVSAITVTTAPLAVETDAANPAITNGGRVTIVIAPEPWLAVALVPDMIMPWPIAPLACEAVDETPDIGPPTSQASP